jgi:hypothetical protein
MIAIHCTKNDLYNALVAVNKLYDNNIRWQREPESMNTKNDRFHFTLRVKKSDKNGARRGFMVNKNGEHKKSIAACWHVHGNFFDKLIEIAPNVEIKAGRKTIDANGGNWQDWNIGSIIEPMYHSEACKCE